MGDCCPENFGKILNSRSKKEVLMSFPADNVYEQTGNK
jgi:hypothetical protein